MITRYEAKFEDLCRTVVEVENKNKTLKEGPLVECPLYIYYLLGFYFDEGLGTPSDKERAKYWYARVGRRGNSILSSVGMDARHFYETMSYKNIEATFVLGLMYERGFYTDKDIDTAIMAYRISAQAGHPDAQFMLATKYETGVKNENGRTLLPVDLDMAKYFYNEAILNEHPYAQVRLDGILRKERVRVTHSQQNISNIVSLPTRQQPQTSHRDSSPIVREIKKLTDINRKQSTNNSANLIDLLIEVGRSTAITPIKKREESKTLNKNLDKLWNENDNFYLSVDDIQKLYSNGNSNTNSLMLYNAFIKGKLIDLIQNSNTTELEKTLKRFTNPNVSKKQAQEFSSEILELCAEPWKVVFHLALANNNIEACVFLLRAVAHTSTPTIHQELQELASKHLDEIQAVNERLMAEEEFVPELLLNATKVTCNDKKSMQKMKFYFSDVYEELYTRSEFQPILNFAALAIKGQLNGEKTIELSDHTAYFKIYVDGETRNVARVKLNSRPTVGVFTYGKKSHSNAIYIGFTDDIDTKGTVIHELTHAMTQKAYQNDCNPYEKGDTTSETRLNAICFRLETRMMEKLALPSYFQAVVSYEINSMYSKLMVQVNKYIKSFNLLNREQRAKKALSSLDNDLCSLYFGHFDTFFKSEYIDNASDDKLSAMCLPHASRFNDICFRFRKKIMENQKLPSFFQTLFSYKTQMVHSELIAYTAEFLSTFDNEEKAGNALYLLDEDLYHFYFNHFLNEFKNEFESLTKVTYRVINESNQLEINDPQLPQTNYFSHETYSQPQPVNVPQLPAYNQPVVEKRPLPSNLNYRSGQPTYPSIPVSNLQLNKALALLKPVNSLNTNTSSYSVPLNQQQSNTVNYSSQFFNQSSQHGTPSAPLMPNSSYSTVKNPAPLNQQQPNMANYPSQFFNPSSQYGGSLAPPLPNSSYSTAMAVNGNNMNYGATKYRSFAPPTCNFAPPKIPHDSSYSYGYKK